MLLDGESLELAQAIEPVLREAGGSGPLKPELMQCQVEISTRRARRPPRRSTSLRELRRGLLLDAAACGIRVAAAGTHPFSRMEEQRVTPRDRYREMVAALRFPARRVVVFGMHVHVAVGGGQKALQVIEALLPDLPILLALSTSSPFLDGEETGLASTRNVLGNAMPRTGRPPSFDTYDDYQASLERLRVAGAMADSTYAWWDVRLHPKFGTVELRIMDVQPVVEDSAAIGGLVQALVRHYGKAYDRGAGFPRADRMIVAENRWLAARHGLRAPLVHRGEEPVTPLTRSSTSYSVASRTTRPPSADWALAQVADVVDRGSSAERQLRELPALGRSHCVLSELADETDPF